MATSPLLSTVLWSFIPSQLTNIALPYATSYFPGYFPPAPPNTLLYRHNYRLVYTIIVGGYLLWSFFGKSDVEVGEDWYALLGVPRNEDDDGLKKAFRTLSRKYHPDRAGRQYENLFIVIRQAYEALSDPVKRYAYDRFGPDVLSWKLDKTVRDFMYTGILRSISFYVVSGGIMLCLSVLQKASQGSYWRYILLALLFYVESSLIMSPTPAHPLIPFIPFLSRFSPSSLNHRPQFIWIRTYHRLFTTCSIALTQLAGIWADPKPKPEDAWIQVEQLVKGLETGLVRTFQSELVPILTRGPEPMVVQEVILSEMEKTIVDRTLSAHPAVRQPWSEVEMRLRSRNFAQRHSHANPGNPALRAISTQNARQASPSLPPSPSPYIPPDSLSLARTIPLPPSPPPSPAPRRARLPRK